MQTIKESSDELNPTTLEVTHDAVAAPRGMRTVRDYLALAVATCGVGFLPIAPGTWGSLVGVGVYGIVRAEATEVFNFAIGREWSAASLEALRVTCILATLIVLSIVGVWAASRTEKLTGRKDPGIVVIDEVIGQLITFIFVPIETGVWTIIVGFFAFRFFDIWKPYPIRRLESLESGLGVMADDVLAGVYAAALMSLLVSIYYLL